MSVTGEHGTVNFTKDDIEIANPHNDEQTNKPFVAYRFSRVGGVKFGPFTNRHIKKQVEVWVCGKRVASIFLNVPIFGGSGVLNALTDADAKKLANTLNTWKCL